MPELQQEIEDFDRRELEKLKAKAIDLKKRKAERMMSHYHLARSLGFTPSEASVLMGRSKDYIERLARQR